MYKYLVLHSDYVLNYYWLLLELILFAFATEGEQAHKIPHKIAHKLQPYRYIFIDFTQELPNEKPLRGKTILLNQIENRTINSNFPSSLYMTVGHAAFDYFCLENHSNHKLKIAKSYRSSCSPRTTSLSHLSITVAGGVKGH